MAGTREIREPGWGTTTPRTKVAPGTTRSFKAKPNIQVTFIGEDICVPKRPAYDLIALKYRGTENYRFTKVKLFSTPCAAGVPGLLDAAEYMAKY